MEGRNRRQRIIGRATISISTKVTSGLLSLSLCFLLVAIAGCAQREARPASGTPTAVHSFVNPVIASDFADPSILQAGDLYFAYATNAYGKHVQVASSHDLVHWDLLSDALPALPSWASVGGSYVWAPEVIQIGTTYVMYYTARDTRSDRQCVGVATSKSPAGKFKDTRSRPLVCQADQGGTIDPSPFRDGQTLYLYFKNDGNCCGQTTYLYAQQLTPDGLSVIGKPTPLVHNEQIWESHVVEAPEMFKHDGKYYLFFSANNYATPDYAVGYALCRTPAGPCTQATSNPMLASHMQPPLVVGPGGESVFQVGQQTWIAYHEWQVTEDGTLSGSRAMCLDRLNWQDGVPHVQGPTTGPQRMPIV